MAQLEPTLHIAGLIEKYLKDEITLAEQAKLNTWLAAVEENQELFSKLTNEEYVNTGLRFFQQLSTEDARQKIATQTWEGGKMIGFNSNKKRWWYAAAAAVLIAGAFAIYQFSNKKEPGAGIAKTTTEKPDIAPGGNKATLTLADGSTIILDSSANGNLTSQGNVKVIKLDGKLSYNSSSSDGEVLYNTISTPKGGQYQLLLADGSQVWLNAASSLRFPASFTGKERKVELTGEGYFDVVKKVAMPFKVIVNGKTEVEVLGTQFNINAYADESTLNTTLIEGSVKFTAVNGESAMLKPGQQAQLSSSVSVINNVNIDEIIAWKSGWFNFDRAGITTIMRQVSRWYDVEVVFEGQPSKKTFSGIVSRSRQISEVLKIMEKAGVKFRIEGKKITVL